MTETKTQQKDRANSVLRIEQAITTIEQLVPLEAVRISMKRKHSLAKAYQSMSLHTYKLGITCPRLGYLYFPKEYAEIAAIVKRNLFTWKEAQKEG